MTIKESNLRHRRLIFNHWKRNTKRNKYKAKQKETIELRLNLQEFKKQNKKILQNQLDIEKNLHAKASSKNCQLEMDYNSLHQKHTDLSRKHQDTRAVNEDYIGQLGRYQEREMKMKQLFSK